jgi:hypothetical protein
MKLGVVSAAPSLLKESVLYANSSKFLKDLTVLFVENATMNNAEVIELLLILLYAGGLINYRRQKTCIRIGLSESPLHHLCLLQKKTG